MKSRQTIARWIKELKAENVPRNLEVYRQGAVMALSCLANDWPAPVKFLRLGRRKLRSAEPSKEEK